MSLTVSTDLRVLVIDEIAELPDPASIAIGTLLHARDTGECRIVVAAASTGVRSWVPFCDEAAGASGPSGPPGVAGPTGLSGSSTVVMSFAGARLWPADGTPELFLANDTPEGPDGAIFESGSPDPIGYGIPLASETVTMIVSVGTNTLVQSCTVWLSKNGVHQASKTVTAGSTGIIPGGIVASFAPGDLVDVSVELSASETVGRVIEVAVTMVFAP